MISEAQFNRGTLDCMTALRRRLKQDLGIVIRLAEPNAVERMLQLSRDSELDEIRELGIRLSGLLAPVSSPDEAVLAQGAIAARRYRDRNSRPSETDREPSAATTASVRIYRGQVIRS